MKSAQESYSRLVRSWIPAEVRRVLDVGCGIGSTALALRRRGLEVEGLSPDPYQQEQFIRRTGLPLHLCRFQEFEPAHPFDLVLMSESSQYISREALFPKLKAVAPHGYLLVADYFVAAPEAEGRRVSGHPLGRFLENAEKLGFLLQRQEDLTERVTPTLDLGALWLERYVAPSIQIVAETAQGRYPRLFGLGRRLFRRPLEKAARCARLLDSEEFKERKRYLLMLLRSEST